MATDVYYSTSPFGTGDLKVTSDITIAGGSGAATFTIAQTGNIGQGDHVISSGVDGYISEMTDSTHATIVTATGAAHGNVSQEALTSISHEYASISALEAGFTDASHLNTTDLVAGDFLVHGMCYYDHDDQTPDSTALILSYGTTDATRSLVLDAPNGGTNSINNQRSATGIFDANKFLLEASDALALIRISDSGNTANGTQLDGLQFHNTNNASGTANCLYNANATTDILVDHCIFSCGQESNGAFISSSSTTIEFRNCLIFNPTTQGGGSEGLYFNSVSTADVFNCTVHNFNDGIEVDGGTVTVTNCAVFGNADDFDGTMTIANCASDDGDGTNAQTLNSATDYAAEFTDITTSNYSLVLAGVCEQNGTDLSGSGVVDDVIGTERPQGSNYDIGAFELIVASDILEFVPVLTFRAVRHTGRYV